MILPFDLAVKHPRYFPIKILTHAHKKQGYPSQHVYNSQKMEMV